MKQDFNANINARVTITEILLLRRKCEKLNVGRLYNEVVCFLPGCFPDRTEKSDKIIFFFDKINIQNFSRATNQKENWNKQKLTLYV